MRKLRTIEYALTVMRAAGLDDESGNFEDLLRAIAAAAIRSESVLEAAARREAEQHGAYGEARDETQIFMDWKFWAESCGVKDLAQLCDEILEGAKEYENGVFAAGGSRSDPCGTDGEKPACDPDGPCDGPADRGCPGTEAGAAETELLGERAEDWEITASWFAGATADGSEEDCRGEVGLPGEGPGEAPHETGRVEGRKKSWEGLPPMSEYRTSLYAQGVCR